MYKKILLVSMLGFTSISYADMYGLGVQVSNDGYVIYVPFELGDSWLVEPYVGRKKNDSKSKDENGADKTEYDYLEVGAGAFYFKGVADDIRVYFGGRVGYVKSTYDWRNSSTSGVSTNNTEEDGYKVGPVLGIIYSFNKNFSVAAEAAYVFKNTEAENKQDYGSGVYESTTNYRVTDTKTNFIARYMF